MAKIPNVAKRERQARVLGYIEQGYTVAEACVRAMVTVRAYTHWRSEDPAFRIKIKALRDRRAGRPTAGIDCSQEAQDFMAFRYRYFGYASPIHHQRIIAKLTGAPPDSITLCLAPPGHGKTTLMVDWICWKLALNPNYRICVISESREHSSKVVSQVARRMTDQAQYPEFHLDFGPFKAPDRTLIKPWGQHALSLMASSHDEKEPSLEARGIGSRIYGSRYDEVWLDDVQSTQNLTATEDLLETFRQDVMTRPMDEGRIYVIGTRVGQGDFYEKLMDNDEDNEALADNTLLLPVYRDNGDPIWPEVWPKARLERRRKRLTEDTWARVYMQAPVSKESATFSLTMWEEAQDFSRSVGQHNHEGMVAFGVDPALTGWTVFVFAHLTATRLELLDIRRREHCSSTEGILDLLLPAAQVHRPSVGICEIGAYQGALARDKRLEEMGKMLGFYVKEHTTVRKKADPVLGVSQMATSFARHEIRIPARDSQSKDTFRPLREELMNWRPDVPTKLLTQDCVMALWFVWRYWQLEVRSLFQRTEPYRDPYQPPSWLKKKAM